MLLDKNYCQDPIHTATYHIFPTELTYLTLQRQRELSGLRALPLFSDDLPVKRRLAQLKIPFKNLANGIRNTHSVCRLKHREDVTAIYKNKTLERSSTEILLCFSCSSVVASLSRTDSFSLSHRCRSLLRTSRCWRLDLVCSSLCSVVWSCLARWLRQARVSRRICFMPLISFLCLERI